MSRRDLFGKNQLDINLPSANISDVMNNIFNKITGAINHSLRFLFFAITFLTTSEIQ